MHVHEFFGGFVVCVVFMPNKTTMCVCATINRMESKVDNTKAIESQHATCTKKRTTKRERESDRMKTVILLLG